MAKQEFERGQIIHKQGEPVTELAIVLAGEVRVTNAFFSYVETNGAILGLQENPGAPGRCEYIAAGKVILLTYAYESQEDLVQLLRNSDPKIRNVLAAGVENSVLQIYGKYAELYEELSGFGDKILEIYNNYNQLCQDYDYPAEDLPGLANLTINMKVDEAKKWSYEYFKALHEMPTELKQKYNAYSVSLIIGNILEASNFMKMILWQISEVTDVVEEMLPSVLGESETDLFQYFSELVLSFAQDPLCDASALENAMGELCNVLEDSSFVDKNLLSARLKTYRAYIRSINECGLNAYMDESMEESQKQEDIKDMLKDSLDQIMVYANLDEAEDRSFRELFQRFYELEDHSSTEDNARLLRRELASNFYDVYEKVFLHAMEDEEVPTVIKMFLDFGYMDRELAGEENAAYLYHLVQEWKPDEENRVLLMADWLEKIYCGEEVPSKNEFDTDYAADLHERRMKGEITQEEEQKLLQDNKAKLHFEIQNLFQLANRITSGSISTFCPVFTQEAVLRSLPSCLLTPEKVRESIEAVRKVDYACFYRETVYTNPQLGIKQEYVQKEVLPYVILLPNIGSRASLWQEIAGAKRDTPARMLMPLFCMANEKDMMLHMAGEFRWELCKRIQGVFWNDVTDRSLTSEYCDYIQFYRKNHELSADAKEHIKIALQRAKNSYREVFVQDYILWVKYEGNGSPRVNKFVRSILFSYCPFAKDIRKEYYKNPMYTELIDRYNIKAGQKQHMYDILCQKIEKAGAKLPEELEAQKNYLYL
ncbi:MAG: hypothetical protein PHP50_00370 [Lachnospiraceae bacterium]|nr:hypothetical protein [Lachnospiraceae bacterium]